jgi:AraC-like DNA-binding protein
MLSPAAGGLIIRFSTGAHCPSAGGGERFRELMTQHVVGLDHEPLTEDGYWTSATAIALPNLGIASSTVMPATVRRTSKLLTDGNDNLRLIMVKRSTTAAIATQFGLEIAVDPGGAVVLSNSEQNSITFPSQVRLLAVNLRRQLLRPLLRDFDAILARPISNHIDGLRLLSTYIGGLIDESELNSADAARLVVTQIYDLAALIMGATRDAAEIAKGRGLRVARLRAIKTDIAERLTSPDLSEETVAMRQRVSPRYVQMLFEQEGITFSQYVIGQRLVRAYRMLTDPRFADRSITSLALDVGFGDLSYFNRAFRRRYGGTPSEIRADAIPRKDA